VKQLQILEWLKNPRAHFREQVDGNLVDDGVCGLIMTKKLGISQPTLTVHMRVLVQAGVVQPKRVKQWTFISATISGSPKRLLRSEAPFELHRHTKMRSFATDATQHQVRPCLQCP
jgi:DNA-binding transcriptional ArsR family regulator